MLTTNHCLLYYKDSNKIGFVAVLFLFSVCYFAACFALFLLVVFVNWTWEQYREYMLKRGLSVKSDGNKVQDGSRLKYRNEKLVVDGHRFDSLREADVYNGLKMAEKAGVISKLELQPRFVLQDAFVGKDGKRFRAIVYVADFRYLDRNGNTIVVDVKSKATEANAVYRLKRKMLLFRYPDILFREIF